ncbi:MAG: WD40 repeat domain-containing protein [Planctomycetota bacterium]|jgi:hypothetical protein
MLHLGSMPSRAAVAGVLALGLSACLYIPPLGEQFTEKEQASIVVGKTTRAEINSMLGEPDRLATPQTAVYQLGRSSGTVVVIFGAGYSGGVAAIPLDHRAFRVVLHFDERDLVDRYEIEAMGHHLLSSGRTGAPLRSASDAGRKLLFAGRGRDFLGGSTAIAFTSVAYSTRGDRIGAAGYKLVGGRFSSRRVWIHEVVRGETRTTSVPDYATLRFAPDLRSAAAMKRKVSVVDLASGNVWTVFDGHGDAAFWSQQGASALAFSPEGDKIATGGMQGYVRIWTSDSGRERLAFRAHEGRVSAVGWSADGNWLATSGADGRVCIWDALRGHEIAKLGEGRRSRATALAFSPRGGVLATSQDTHLELWSLGTGDGTDPSRIKATLRDVVLLPYRRSNFPVRQALGFSAQGDLLAASRGYLLLYDVDLGRTVARVKPDNGELAGGWMENDSVLALAFSPDGTTLATGSSAGLHVWPVGRLRTLDR